MFVGGNGDAKSDIAQVLQSVGERVVLKVPGLPEAVSRREFLWRKGSKSQQVIRPVFDHVDSQVVSGVDTKVWPPRITKGESFKFQQTVEGRVFHSLDFWNVHQSPDCLRVVDLPARRKHRPQFERQHVWIVSTYASIDLSDFRGSLAVQARGLE